MIVQCKKCETKFRFDASLIDGEGAWVRCGRCKQVFFLDKPLTDNNTSSRSSQPAEPFMDKREEEILSLKEKNFKGAESSEMKQESLMEDIEEDAHKIDEDKKTSDGNNHHVPVFEEKRIRSQGKQLAYLFILLLLGGAYVWFFTEIGHQAVNIASSTLWTWMDKVAGISMKVEEVGPAQVDLTDVRQRLVASSPLGILRVVEGTAVNQSKHPMTRIKVKGEIMGDGGVLLVERESYCGNLLSGDELATMTEEQINKELSNPQGSDVSNDKIAPKGQIPFMIVFAHEPSGVLKTFVEPVGAERLLP